jgi:Ankyrin repeats (many copies)
MSWLRKRFGAGPKAEDPQARAKGTTAFASIGEAVLEAAKSGDLEALRSLARSGADLSVRDKAQDWTPLMFAIGQGHTDAATFLIESGADVNSEATTGTTALMVAAIKANAQVVGRLLQAQVDTTAREMHGRTALDLVSMKLQLLGQHGDNELAAVRDALSHGATKAATQVTSLDADGQPAAIPVILAQLDQTHNTSAAATALLEVFRAAQPSRLDDDGVCVKRATKAEGTHRVPVGADDGPARVIVGTPGVCRAVRDLCDPEEYERLVIVAEGFQNPEWYRALVKLGTSRAAGAILAGWTTLRRRDDPHFALGIDALEQLGPKAHDRLLRALEGAYTQSWAYPAMTRQFRGDILVVLAATGDRSTMKRLRDLARTDTSLSEDATSAVAAIEQRLG